MEQQITDISKFKFSSLHKYLHPIYSILHHNANLTSDEKKLLVHNLIPAFFKRMREYRDVPLERVATASDLSCDYLLKFEKGEVAALKELELAYCRVCSGLQEYHCFLQHLHEFMHPSVKETKQAIALDVLKRFGISIPTVDYKNLHSPYTSMGKILKFPITSN